MLQCVAVCRSMMQCVAMCCSATTRTDLSDYGCGLVLGGCGVNEDVVEAHLRVAVRVAVCVAVCGAVCWVSVEVMKM